MNLHKRLQDALDHDWTWEVGGRYDRYYIDQYDLRDGGSKATYSTITVSDAFTSRQQAERIAQTVNQAYLEGVRRGRAEILKSLWTRYEEYCAEGGSFNIEEFINDFSERIEK